jgi:uncharacterized protein
MSDEQPAEGVTGQSSALGPIRTTERLFLLDVLRGFAILGILLVNNHLGILEVEAFFPSASARLGQNLISVFGSSKFWPLFAVLFGIGLSIQIGRAQARGVAILPVYLRRLFFLALLGSALNLFLFVPYLLHLSVAGVSALFVGYFLRNRRPTWVLMAALGVLVIYMTTWTASDLATPDLSGPPNLSQEEVSTRIEGLRTSVQEEAEAPASWSFPSLSSEITGHISFLRGWFRVSVVRYRGRVDLVFFMLLGIFLWRLGVLEKPEKHRRFFVGLLFVAFPIGLGAAIYSETVRNNTLLTIVGLGSYPTPFMKQIWYPANIVASLGMCMSYVAGIALLLQRPPWVRLLQWFAPVGRLALTNYALQALLPALVFGKYIPGFPRMSLGVWGGILVLTGLFTIQIVFSRAWIRHYQFGPLEWVWRSLTYWKPQPMRVERTVPVGEG